MEETNEKKERVSILLKTDKKLKDRLSAIAQKENRSLNNLIETVLIHYVESQGGE